MLNDQFLYNHSRFQFQPLQLRNRLFEDNVRLKVRVKAGGQCFETRAEEVSEHCCKFSQKFEFKANQSQEIQIHLLCCLKGKQHYELLTKKSVRLALLLQDKKDTCRIQLQHSATLQLRLYTKFYYETFKPSSHFNTSSKKKRVQKENMQNNFKSTEKSSQSQNQQKSVKTRQVQQMSVLRQQVKRLNSKLNQTSLRQELAERRAEQLQQENRVCRTEKDQLRKLIIQLESRLKSR